MPQKNKILFILHLPPPIHGASVMGKYIKDSKLINENFDCYFINYSVSMKVHEVGKLGVRKLFFFIFNFFEVIFTFFRVKPDLCYITPTSDGYGVYRDFILLQVLKIFGANILLHFHNKADEFWLKKPINKKLLKYLFKKVKIILLGQELYAEKSPFISKDRVFFCHNGIPSINKFVIKRDNVNKVKFLFLSNMMIEKGIYILLEACACLRNKGYDFHCDFVGGWKDISETEFTERVEKLNLQKSITVHGPKFGKDKDFFLRNADVFVFPTFYHGETFGLVLLEAMDYSIPCISTANGAITSVIQENYTGFCIEQRRIDILTEKMIWMIEHPEERKQMGYNGKRRFDETFTILGFEKRMTSILNDCLN